MTRKKFLSSASTDIAEFTLIASKGKIKPLLSLTLYYKLFIKTPRAKRKKNVNEKRNRNNRTFINSG